jgi:hypothetical protein
MVVLVGLQAARLASTFVTSDTKAATQFGTFHTADR